MKHRTSSIMLILRNAPKELEIFVGAINCISRGFANIRMQYLTGWVFITGGHNVKYIEDISPPISRNLL